jgi:PmbA protein
MQESSTPEQGQAALNSLRSLITECLEEARCQGATGAEAGASIEQGLSVTSRLGEVETIEHHRSRGLGITVYIGQRKGSASTSDISRDAMREAVQAACRIARYAAEDPYGGLPDANRLATEFPELDLYHPWSLEAQEAIALTLACENAALGHHYEIRNSEGASLNTFEGMRVLGNSLGFLHGYATSRHSLSCSVIGQRGEEMQRDDWWTVAREAKAMEAPEAVGRQAAERTLRRLGARPLGSRQCPVIFAADVAGSLVGHFLGAIRGGNLYRKSTFLLDHLGKAVFPAFVQIEESPHIPRGLASAPYDSEGVATRPHSIVRDGVLESYILSSYSARKLGMETTGNAGGVHNILVRTGSASLTELLQQMDTGLLVTELMGQGVNIVTGDYSRGAAGFWVEKGQISHPVEEFTIAGNLRDMYCGLVAIGNDIDPRSSIRTGSIWLDRITIAGHG